MLCMISFSERCARRTQRHGFLFYWSFQISRLFLQEVKDVQEQYERYKDEMADVAETVEIATLDKEMAEERVSLARVNNHPHP